MAAKVQFRRGAWWVVSHADGKRSERRIGPSERERRQAEAVAERMNVALAARKFGIAMPEPAKEEPASPTFSAFAERYLKEDTAHLSATTRKSRESILRKKDDEKKPGPILPHLGDLRLDEITAPRLRAWYAAEVEAKGKSRSTGRNWINTLAAVYAYARDLELVDEHADPTDALRRVLSRKARSKSGRLDPRENIRPIEDPKALAKLVAEAYVQGDGTRRDDPTARWVPPAAVLLLLDTGMRVGELRALTWGQVAWGQDENDRSRHVWIDRSNPSGGEGVEGTKSGRARAVRLSRRLRRALWTLYEARFRPGPDALVLGEGFDSNNFRRREWRKICEQAGTGTRALKDLRDTFACQLLTSGVGLERISKMLGHSTVALTERHYARWIDEEEDREPFRLAPGEVVPDLLARLPDGKGPQDRWTARTALCGAVDPGRLVAMKQETPGTSAITGV